MISVLSGIVLMVAIGTVIQQAEGFGSFFGATEADDVVSADTVTLIDDFASVPVDTLGRIDVLRNDNGIGPAQLAGLRVVQRPTCGQVFIQDGALQYLPSVLCGAEQEVVYTVPGAGGRAVATVNIAVPGGRSVDSAHVANTPAEQEETAAPRAARVIREPGVKVPATDPEIVDGSTIGSGAPPSVGTPILPEADAATPADTVSGRQTVGFTGEPARSEDGGSDVPVTVDTAETTISPEPTQTLAEPDPPANQPSILIAMVDLLEPRTEPPSTIRLAAADSAWVLLPAENVREPEIEPSGFARVPVVKSGLGPALDALPILNLRDAAPTAPTEVGLNPPGPIPAQAPDPNSSPKRPTFDPYCVTPPSLSLDVRRGGRTIVAVHAPCQANDIAELRYSGISLGLALDSAGLGETVALGFETNTPAKLQFNSGPEIEFDLLFRGMHKVSRVAVAWDMPVELELNALEFGARMGSKQHVRPANPRSFSEVREAGGGYLNSYRSISGLGQNLEIYSYYGGRNAESGAVRLLLDYASRSRGQIDGTCGDGVFATPQYLELRSVGGTASGPTLRRVDPIDCSELVSGFVSDQLKSGVVADLLIDAN